MFFSLSGVIILLSNFLFLLLSCGGGRLASDNLTPNRSKIGTNCCYSKTDPKNLLPYFTIITLKQVLIIIAMCRVPVSASEHLLKVNNKDQRLLTRQNTRH